MKKIFFALLGLTLVGASYDASAASSMANMNKRITKAADILGDYEADFAHAIPTDLVDHAYCITAIPDVISAGFIFGGKRGRGISTCRTPQGWSNPVFTDISGASWGLQIGVQGTDMVLVWTRPTAREKLSKNDVTLGAGAAIAVGPVGRDARANTDFTLSSEVYSYSRSRGLYAGITLEGSVLDFDDDDNAKFYNNAPSVSILSSNGDARNQAIAHLMSALDSLSPASHAQIDIRY
jgi:lipid-binding SYLF domain-containing protein